MTQTQLNLLDAYIDLRTRRALVDARVLHMDNQDSADLSKAVEEAWWKLCKALPECWHDFL